MPLSVLPSSRARFVTLLLVLAACGDGGSGPDPLPAGFRVISGGIGEDSVLVARTAPLVLEVRATGGALLRDTTVRFESPAPADAGRAGERGVLACAVATTPCTIGAGFTHDARTDAQGRVTVQVRHGTVAGTSWLRFSVPGTSYRDSVSYVTRPGAAVSVQAELSDSLIMVGGTAQLTATTLDQFDNASTAGLTVVPTGGVTVGANGQVTGAAVGHARIRASAGALRDSVQLLVMPAGRFAAAGGMAVVAQNFDGSARVTRGGVGEIGIYGLRPVWLPGTERVIVHSLAQGSARLHAVDMASGTVQVVNAAPPATLAHEWYPDAATAEWIYFMGETTSGSYAVMRIRPDGSMLQQMAATAPSYGGYYRPALSPDGSKLAVQVVHEGTVHVGVFSAATGAALSPLVPSATAPRWSPDGAWVAMARPGSGTVRVMRADGSELRTISPAAYGEWLDWTADGEWLVTRGPTGALFLVRVSNGEVLDVPDSAGLWQPAVKR